jgi:hypothetical protein
MNKQLTMLAAGFAGVGLMYFLDPILGRRRRALFADKAGHYSRKMKHAMDLTARDFGHRVQGVVARGKRAFDNTEVPGEVLIERVRTELGRVISHPSAISVSVSGGEVFLFGPVLDDERKALLKRVRSILGVHKVHDRLQPQTESSPEQAERGYGRPVRRAGFWASNWPPAKRAFAVAAGLSAVAVGTSRRSFPGALLACGGAGFLTRGLLNRRLRARQESGVSPV